MATVTYDVDLGSANAGAFPSFAIFKRADTLADVAAPLLEEKQAGVFTFAVDWSANPAITAILYKIIVGGVEVPGLITARGDSGMLYGAPWYFVDFGSINAGGTPSFLFFNRSDSNTAVAQPSYIEVGSGIFAFSYAWTTAPAQTVEFKWTLGGVEVSGVISSADVTVILAPLPGQKTLADLRLAAQQRADMVNSGFVTTAEWTTYLNGSWARLYGLLIEKFGCDYYAPERYTLTTTASADTYPLPDGSTGYVQDDGATTAPALFKLLGVDVKAQGTPSGWLPLRPFPMGERNGGGIAMQATRRPRYRLAKNSLWLQPQPQGGLTLRVLYAPRLVPLVNDTDLLDGVNGWEEYVVLDAARKALQKEESDTSAIEREIAELVARLEHEADNRDAGEPATVADVVYGGGDLPGGYGWSY